MKILRLEISNLLRIKAAEVQPDGSLVIVGGNNGQGKSSLLNAIAMALSGKDLPERPVHEGASKGYVILQTETLTVTRKFSVSGAGSLEVRDAENVAVTSPQAKLDALVSRITFDPYAFITMKPAAQLDTVRKIVGLDFTALDGEHAKVYLERTETNRQVKLQEGVLSGLQRVAAPAEEVSIAGLTAELREAQAKNGRHAQERIKLSSLNDRVDDAETATFDAFDEVKELEVALENARKKHATAVQVHQGLVNTRNAAKAAVAELVDVDTNSLLSQIAEAESVNVKVRGNLKWNEEHRKKVTLEGKSADLTARMEEIATEKETKLAAAKFPVDGLGFNDAGVTLNKLPFEQAGTAEKIRTSIAIARSLNPEFPVMLIRDGSLLDETSLALVAAEAEKHNLQIWLEMVGSRDDSTIIIEDGEVVATPAADKKKADKKK